MMLRVVYYANFSVIFVSVKKKMELLKAMQWLSLGQ